MSERGCVPFVYDITGKIAPGGRDTNAFNLTEFIRMCDELDVRVIFVCLPTPMTQAGHADLTVVESALAEIAEIPTRGNYERVAVVKSTVPPGTCVSWDNKFAHKGLRVVFNPEFLTEARAIDDMRDGGKDRRADRAEKRADRADARADRAAAQAEDDRGSAAPRAAAQAVAGDDQGSAAAQARGYDQGSYQASAPLVLCV
jgi:hypothetical protein